MQIGWVDVGITAIILFYAGEGYNAGAISSLFDFVKFLLSFLIGLKIYVLVGNLFVLWFNLSQGIAKAVGFFIAIFLAEIVLHIILRPLFLHMSLTTSGIWKTIDRTIGAAVGVFSALLFLMVLLSIFVAVPVAPVVKKAIVSSTIANGLLSQTQDLEKSLHGVFEEATGETLNFLTVKPDSNSLIRLDFTVTGIIDTESEKQMLRLVNVERTKRGIPVLVFDLFLQQVARAHAQEMLHHGYFSHYTPEGASPFDRMNAAGIIYEYAGENLALSPDVTLAMQGLMESKGHRENILYPHFKKVGLGVLDAGLYGKMFVQEFTD